LRKDGNSGRSKRGGSQILEAKEQRRRDLARLPFPAKVRAVIQLQEIAATILRARGKIVRPCNVSAGEKNPSASRASPTKS
jgi:hypothetical protein